MGLSKGGLSKRQEANPSNAPKGSEILHIGTPLTGTNWLWSRLIVILEAASNQKRIPPRYISWSKKASQQRRESSSEITWEDLPSFPHWDQKTNLHCHSQETTKHLHHQNNIDRGRGGLHASIPSRFEKNLVGSFTNTENLTVEMHHLI